MSFLENSADIYGDDPVVPVCPNVTRWTEHERACLTFFKGYGPFLHALTVGYKESREEEALGLFIGTISQQTNITILIPLEEFNCIKAMLLNFQKTEILFVWEM